MSDQERRKERRYVVDSVNLIVGEERHPVIDISQTAARISCTFLQLREGEGPLKLEFCSDEKTRVFEVNSEVHRYTDLYVVISYDPPKDDWESYIRRFDTFHVDDLDVALFD